MKNIEKQNIDILLQHRSRYTYFRRIIKDEYLNKLIDIFQW